MARTPTVSPTFTSPMAASAPSTWTSESAPTAYVLLKPSADFTVIEVALTAVTSPRCTSTVA